MKSTPRASGRKSHLFIASLSVGTVGLLTFGFGTALAKDGPKFGPQPPTEVAGKLLQESRAERDRAASLFSWKTFVALQWPAAEGVRGKPDLKRRPGAPGERVWETWREPMRVYLPEGKRPSGWESLPSTLKTLTRISKVSDELDAKIQAAQADGRTEPVLTDQDGHLVRYEIRMNRVVFEHILKNKLYDGRVQTKVGHVSYPNGSCLIKASWKEIKPGEESHYISSRCVIYTDGKPRGALMGLVGFHMMVKTPSAPQWIWSTFEQVDNVGGNHPSFFDRAHPELPVNRQTLPGHPNQVTRVVPIPEWLRSLNTEIQQEFAKDDSPLQYYELVETQRPIPASQQEEHPTVFEVEPVALSNTTQETFVQDSSCMGCHAMAATLNDHEFVSGDFTFTLNDAYPKPKSLGVIDAPSRPETDWDHQHWSEIERGQALSSRTFELLPENVGNRLHCASCHLDAGRKETSSWWVGMPKKYDYPASDRLQNRINACFTHSMNGKAVDDKELQAIIAYIQWIDEQAKPEQKEISGFPDIEALTGDPSRGQKIYRQKCNFCHSNDGEGRYLGGVYFRPALWGPESFPKRAGMGETRTLAAFLRHNMPLGSGGLLTSQEAWDLAAFIESQKRP